MRFYSHTLIRLIVFWLICPFQIPRVFMSPSLALVLFPFLLSLSFLAVRSQLIVCAKFFPGTSVIEPQDLLPLIGGIIVGTVILFLFSFV